jgi:outer membrane protein assembly factor BamA
LPYNHLYFRAIVFIALFCFSNIQQSNAQTVVTDSTEFAFLPAIAFNSDLGLIGGGVANWYIYKDDTYPFFGFINLSAIISTKGLASFSLLYDKPYAFNKDLRLTSEIYASRFFEDTYFGIANYSTIDNPPEDNPDFYLFKSFSAGFRVNGRLPLIRPTSRSQLDANLIVNYRYETPWDNGTDRLITNEAPLGVDGGTTAMLGAGLIWEARNSEFLPTKGSYASSSLEVGNSLWGSSYDLTVFESDLRYYFTFTLLKPITFANRINARFSNGEIPYWKLSYAGDDETLRGYESRRFTDDHAIVLNSELRTWLLEFPEFDTRFGGTLFMDTGRTFSAGTTFEQITNDLKTTFGFGLLASLFTPDFIIRGDFGFSEEGIGVYFTTGFMF